MNKLQELGVGLVLLFGGDGPTGQRAGDALLAERIGAAVQNGGFSDITYATWRKSQASVARLEFDAIHVERGAGTVDVESAEVDVFSQALRFSGGRFGWRDVQTGWQFETVEIAPGGLFRGALRISARGLIPTPAVQDAWCADAASAHCALVRLGSASVERFDMIFRKRNNEAVMTLAWQSAGRCTVVWTSDGRGSDDLATWGRRYLAAPSDVQFRMAMVPCGLVSGRFGSLDADGLREGAERPESIGGDSFLAAAPVLAATLFGLVAESYAYLLE